jgi:hypothetical protein
MNKKLTALFALIIILAFIGYMIYDASSGPKKADVTDEQPDTVIADSWMIDTAYKVTSGELTSVTASFDGVIFLGGDTFIESLDSSLHNLWIVNPGVRITALAVSGDTIYASTMETILLFSKDGKRISEWGPYESGSIITSVSANSGLVAFADAGNKMVYILKKNGELVSMAGLQGENFVIPSPYFDVALSEDHMYAANTGKHRLETWNHTGRYESQFGEPGTAPGSFCGCCNPAHFALVPEGFVTAEKGINRIKLLDRTGAFIEFVSNDNDFVPSVPLDVAAAGSKIYAANKADSTLYIFIHK